MTDNYADADDDTEAVVASAVAFPAGWIALEIGWGTYPNPVGAVLIAAGLALIANGVVAWAQFFVTLRAINRGTLRHQMGYTVPVSAATVGSVWAFSRPHALVGLLATIIAIGWLRHWWTQNSVPMHGFYAIFTVTWALGGASLWYDAPGHLQTLTRLTFWVCAAWVGYIIAYHLKHTSLLSSGKSAR